MDLSGVTATGEVWVSTYTIIVCIQIQDASERTKKLGRGTTQAVVEVGG